MLVPDNSFADNGLFIVDCIIESLLVRHDDKLRMAQVFLNVIQRLSSARTSRLWITRCKVNVESDTIDLIGTTNCQILPLVKAVENFVIKELFCKVFVVD